jgi:4Fe-4S ferredoxin
MVSNTKEVKALDFDVTRSAEKYGSWPSKTNSALAAVSVKKFMPQLKLIELGDIGAIVRTDADVSKICVDENKCVCAVCAVSDAL